MIFKPRPEKVREQVIRKDEEEHCGRKAFGPRAGLACLRGSKESSMAGVE